MTTTYAAVAQAVVDELNAGTFSQAFAAARHYTLDFANADIKELVVAVVPRSRSGVIQDRRSAREEVSIDVGVIKRVEPSLAAVDGLVELVDEIKTMFFMKQLSTVAAICLAYKNEPIYSPEKLADEKQFLSVLTFTFVLAG